MIVANDSEYEGMKAASLLTSQVLDYITDHIKVGTSTKAIDKLCHDMIVQAGATPGPYSKGFPGAVCTSVNHVVCHGIPSESKILKDGDIINVDACLELNGWFGDSSRMYVAGNSLNPKAKNLIQVTYDSMMAGINAIADGVSLINIGTSIQNCAESHGFSVVRDFTGHGIGRELHDNSITVLSFAHPSQKSFILKEGMCFTVEPMINVGKYHVRMLPDGWTAVTKDKSLSAQFEHTIMVTKTGCEILTLSEKGLTHNLERFT